MAKKKQAKRKSAKRDGRKASRKTKASKIKKLIALALKRKNKKPKKRK